MLLVFTITTHKHENTMLTIYSSVYEKLPAHWVTKTLQEMSSQICEMPVYRKTSVW